MTRNPPNRKKFILSKKRKASFSGQATTEYILLLVVVIGILMLAVGRFFKPLGAWTDYQMRAYLFCLLDQGKLPALGGGDSVQDNGCQPPEWKSSSMDSGGGSGSNGGSGSSDSKKDSSKDKKNSKNKEAADSGLPTASSGGSSSAASSQRSSSGISEPPSPGTNSEASKALNQEAEADGSKRSRPSRFRNYNLFEKSASSKGMTLENDSQLSYYDKVRIKKMAEAKKNVVGELRYGENPGKPKKFLLKKANRDLASQEVKIEPWDFGRLFRILIIVAIIIALILFLAGQLNQIRKSYEK